jgi:hypothetical protein
MRRYVTPATTPATAHLYVKHLCDCNNAWLTFAPRNTTEPVMCCYCGLLWRMTGDGTPEKTKEQPYATD